ncbi:MAG: ESPR-type extended signal peptide-containing protein, partial [Acinetobacter amyesii]|uniref:ESPR-type extended signal peptide-containing protein n=1 Tax=Acinetobacter amyesii TaxID=2942470 RepID=UPI003CFC6399
MNKIYRVVWNASLGVWVAVQETAKSNTKHKSVVKRTDKKAESTQKSFLLSILVRVLISSGLLLSANLVSAAAGTGSGSNGGNTTSTAISAGCTAAQATSNYSLAFGCNAQAGTGGKDDVQAIAIGKDSISWAYGVAIGTSASADQAAYAPGKGGVAVGYKAETGGWSTSAIAIGNNAFAGLKDTKVVNGGIAFGESTSSTANNSIAIGTKANATKDDSVALGSNATTDTNASSVVSSTLNGLTYSDYAGQVKSAGMQVSVGSVGNERQIKNVAAGNVSDSSTDAINGSQLFATNAVLGNVANSTKGILGGNAALDPNGSITMTNIGNTGKDTVHDAILASQEEVKAGTNIASVDKSTGTNGQDIYTVNAK